MYAEELHEDVSTMTYEEILLEDYKFHLKRFVDWFLIQFRPLLIKRCRYASRASGLGKECWEDLLSECCVEAYRIADRFQAEKGDLQKFLIHSLWNFPLRNNNVRRYRSQCECVEMGVDQIEAEETASDTADDVHFARLKIATITEPLNDEEKAVIQLHYGFGLSNITIGKFVGRNESTIRHRLNSALGKIKIKGVNIDD